MSELETGAVQVGRSATANQNFHWRNLLDGLLRLSRGNIGEASPADVMRVKADNSVEFPGGISGGFASRYESPEQAITSGGLVTLTHGLPSTPRVLTGVWVCKTAENGYSVGDEIYAVFGAFNSASSDGMAVFCDAVNISCRFGSGTNPIISINKTTGALFRLTSANWRLVVRAWA